MQGNDLVVRLLDKIPKDSIGRYDLFPVFQDKELFHEIIMVLALPYIEKVDFVAAPEAIGWIMGSAVAKELNVGFIPLRKKDKLPYPKEALVSRNYIDYSGKEKAFEIKKEFVTAGNRILIVDEWVETGASLHCSMSLLKQLGCIIIGLATIGIDYCEGTKEWIDSGFIKFIGMNI